ncbi:MAG: LLM class F420-dependent oxidoreductase [Candidatus Rokuibacteriota bacterium]|nr:MAG: LLM class F420-dependent oxidoreductase [Candidatus Rokubacteria bacterium]
MRVGLNLAHFAAPGGSAELGANLTRVAQRAEAAGFESLWVWDHLLWCRAPIGPGVTDREMIEAYTTLGFLAGVTRTVRLGTMVAAVTFRHPGVLVKQVTTLDVLSGGRAICGLGAGWFEEEHRALGIPFPTLTERFERLEETVRIARLMWADAGAYDQAVLFSGSHYRLDRTLNVPQAIQRPHPPILIGGGGEQKTLRLVAQHADACNLTDRLTPGELAHKLAVLRRHCDRLGRPYEAIEKTLSARLPVTGHGQGEALSVPEVLAYCQTVAALGFDTLILLDETPSLYDPALLDAWATRLIPAIRQIPVAGRP